MPKTVLVVEDDPLLRVDAAVLFEESGHDVVQLESADDALDYLMQHASRVAAVLTDVNLPGNLDGFDLAEAVISNWPGIVVLVATGEAREPADLPQNVRFVRKPWLPLEVMTAVNDAVT